MHVAANANIAFLFAIISPAFSKCGRIRADHSTAALFQTGVFFQMANDGNLS
ncbi:hypothetical protein ACWYXN_23420 [Janthinobacterium aestuarii]|uniref:hypothetical protein n=1 Tax=Janthinobacterium lividum TaxID=29581 RepID=UPI0016796DDA|nr:hypothetical protein [Janthinobacterium lividum]